MHPDVADFHASVARFFDLAVSAVGRGSGQPDVAMGRRADLPLTNSRHALASGSVLHGRIRLRR